MPRLINDRPGIFLYSEQMKQQRLQPLYIRSQPLVIGVLIVGR